jgi:hypothetical protein
VLNDQFAAAYRRNLVTVECRVPISEIGAHHAKYAKDTTGWVEWKPGGVAGKLMKVKPEYTRKLFVSRYMLPVRIIPDSEVAQMYKEYLDGTNIKVPWNVVTPSLRKELVKAGVKISYKDVVGGNYTRVFKEIFPEDATEMRFSERNNAPVFYSQMGKVVDGMKQEKFGASSVISMLRGRGVKAEEIRWSGIHAFLDGKKSVTKAELLEFIKGSMLHIEETMLDDSKIERAKLPDNYRLTDETADNGDRIRRLYIDGKLVDTFEEIGAGGIESTGNSNIWAMDEADLTG